MHFIGGVVGGLLIGILSAPEATSGAAGLLCKAHAPRGHAEQLHDLESSAPQDREATVPTR
jgi:ammonia channel protein AmtB